MNVQSPLEERSRTFTGRQPHVDADTRRVRQSGPRVSTFADYFHTDSLPFVLFSFFYFFVTRRLKIKAIALWEFFFFLFFFGSTEFEKGRCQQSKCRGSESRKENNWQLENFEFCKGQKKILYDLRRTFEFYKAREMIRLQFASFESKSRFWRVSRFEDSEFYKIQNEILQFPRFEKKFQKFKNFELYKIRRKQSKSSLTIQFSC